MQLPDMYGAKSIKDLDKALVLRDRVIVCMPPIVELMNLFHLRDVNWWLTNSRRLAFPKIWIEQVRTLEERVRLESRIYEESPGGMFL